MRNCNRIQSHDLLISQATKKKSINYQEKKNINIHMNFIITKRQPHTKAPAHAT